MASHKSKVKDLPAEAQAEAASLKKLIGRVTTPGQILKAAHYLDHLKDTENDELRERVFEAVMEEGADFVRAWDEISFCRMIGEPAAHVVRTGPGPENKRLFEELHILAQHWVMLAGNRVLGKLGEHKDVKTAEAGSCSMPGQLRAYLEAYRREKGFDQWTYAHMSDARSKVVEVCYEFQQKKGLFPPGTAFFPFHSRGRQGTDDYPDSPASKSLRERRRRDEASKVQERLAEEKSKLVKMAKDKTIAKDMIQLQHQLINLFEKRVKESLKIPRAMRPKNVGAQEADTGGLHDETLELVEPRKTDGEGSSSLNDQREPLRKRRRANLSIATGLTPRSNAPSIAAAPVETGDLEAAKAVASAEVIKLLKLSNAAKTQALEVRRSCDSAFNKLNGVLAKWTEGHSIQMPSWEDVYMSDIFALQQLAAEHQQAKASIEEADRREAEAQNKLDEARAGF